MADRDDEKTKQDEEIKSFCASRALKKLGSVSKFLEDVALDDSYRDKKMVKVKVWDDKIKNEYHYELEEQEVPVSVNIRVTAAKTWKELIADKAIGDIKEKAKEGRREGMDIKKAMEAIAKAKAAEKKAAEDIEDL